MIYIPTSKEEVDLTDKEAVINFLKKEEPDAILNFAAFTAVDLAEQKPDEALRLNAELPQWLASYTKNSNRLLIHISTDHIFGNKVSTTPYTEIDMAAPINMYGKSKHIGEEAILDIAPQQVYILRTAWLYSPSLYGRSFYRSILQSARNHQKLRVVTDEVGSPTSAFTLSRVINSFYNIGKKTDQHPEGYTMS